MTHSKRAFLKLLLATLAGWLIAAIDRLMGTRVTRIDFASTNPGGIWDQVPTPATYGRGPAAEALADSRAVHDYLRTCERLIAAELGHPPDAEWFHLELGDS